MIAVTSTLPPLPLEVVLVDASDDAPAIVRALTEARPTLAVVIDASGTAWAERLSVGRPCAVIVDRRIGAANGLEILARVRDLDPFCARVVCTRDPDPAHVVAALRDRCDDYIVREGAWIDELVGRVLALVDDPESRHVHEAGAQAVRDLLGAAPVIITQTAPSGRFLYVSARGRELAGFGEGPLNGANVDSFYGRPADRAQLMERLAAEGVAELRGMEVRGADGRSHWFDTVTRAVRDEHGALRRISAIAVETTERELAYRVARGNEARYRTLAEAIPDVFCVFDADLRCIYWNRAAELLTGRAADSVVGRRLEEALPKLPGTPSYDLLARALEEQSSLQVEMPMGLYLKPGAYDVRFIGANGVVALLARDVTERQGSEARLRAALAEKEVLLQEVHHRVKNNLQVILSLLSLKLRSVEDVSVRAQVADTQGRVLAMALVHEYLYRSGDLGKLDLREYVTRLVEGTLVVLDQSATTRAELSVEEVSLGLDVAMRLGFVIHELVSNACKHAWPDGRKGMVRIAFRCVNPVAARYELIVADDGVGLTPVRPIRGTLGLELVERLLLPFRGVLRIESRRGTTVTAQFEDRAT